MYRDGFVLPSGSGVPWRPTVSSASGEPGGPSWVRPLSARSSSPGPSLSERDVLCPSVFSSLRLRGCICLYPCSRTVGREDGKDLERFQKCIVEVGGLDTLRHSKTLYDLPCLESRVSWRCLGSCVIHVVCVKHLLNCLLIWLIELRVLLSKLRVSNLFRQVSSKWLVDDTRNKFYDPYSSFLRPY